MMGEAERDDWIRTVLMVVSSQPQRKAFVAGYNGARRPPAPATEAKWTAFNLGQRVRDILKQSEPSNG